MCVRSEEAESEGLGVLLRGRFTRPGTHPSRRGHSARAGTGILSPTASNAPGRAGMSPAVQDVPGRGDTHPAVRNCPRRRGTSLWTVPPQIEDVLFGRGLRSPTEGDGSGAVVWGRSTSWAQNAVLDGCAALSVPVRAGCEHVGPFCRYGGAPPDGPGLPRGAVVETSQGRPVNLVVVFTVSKGARCPRWTRLPVPGCSGIGFAPWLQDDASTPPPAPRLCASGPRSRARPTTNRQELGAVPTPPVPLTGPPDVG